MDCSLSFFYVAGLPPISNVWCSSGVFVVFWYVVKLSHGRWHSCVKGAVECQLVVAMVLVLFGAFYVLQDVWVWHYFCIAVLIRDRVVVLAGWYSEIFSLKEPCPGNRLVTVIWRSESRLPKYSLSELCSFRRFSFLAAMGILGLALKTAGGRFCCDEMRVLSLSSSSDPTSDSDEFCLSVCSSVHVLSLTFWVFEHRESSMSDSDYAYSCAAICSVDVVTCYVLLWCAAYVRL